MDFKESFLHSPTNKSTLFLSLLSAYYTAMWTSMHDSKVWCDIYWNAFILNNITICDSKNLVSKQAYATFKECDL